MAASNVTIEVQEYLDKHKITTLFEDLKNKLMKDLPGDPLSYLINALRVIQDKKKRVPPSRVPGGVVGKSVTPVDKLAKSADNVRPSSGQSASTRRLPQSTSSSSVTSRKPTTSGAPAASKTATAKVVSRTPRATPGSPRVTPGSPRVTPGSPRTSKVTTTTTTTSKSTRPSTAPTTTTTTTRSTRVTKTASSSSTSKTSKPSATSKTSPTKITKPAIGATKRPSKPGGPSKPSGPSKPTGSLKPTGPSEPTSSSKPADPDSSKPADPNSTKPADPVSSQPAADEQTSKEVIDEFFGEKKKSSSQQVFVSEQEDVEQLEETKEQPMPEEEAEVPTVVTEDSDNKEKAGAEEKDICDLYEDMKKNKSGTKQPAMMRNEHLKNLQEIIVTEQQAEQASGGHDDGDDNGSEVEEAVALIEDTEQLKEDEGVEPTANDPTEGAQMTTRKQGKQPTFIVLIVQAIVESDIAAADTAQDDFESASQVASGSTQENFPSCDANTSVTEQWSTADNQKLEGSNDDDENTVVTMTTTTATSEDEWVGLQQTRQPVDQSETESEIQVPQVPLTGKSWTPPAEESGDATATQQWAT